MVWMKQLNIYIIAAGLSEVVKTTSSSFSLSQLEKICESQGNLSGIPC
jgi:hypothetical protein